MDLSYRCQLWPEFSAPKAVVLSGESSPGGSARSGPLFLRVMFLSSDHERLVRLLIRLIYSERDPDNLRRLEAQLECLLKLEASDSATALHKQR
jgi:hypothetical protein